MKADSFMNFKIRKNFQNKSETIDKDKIMKISDNTFISSDSKEVLPSTSIHVKRKNPIELNSNDGKINIKRSFNNINKLKVHFQEEIPSKVKKPEKASSLNITYELYSKFDNDDEKNKSTQCGENLESDRLIVSNKESDHKRQYYYDMSSLPHINNKIEQKANKNYYSNLYASHWNKMKQYSNNLSSTQSKSAFHIDDRVFETKKFNNYLGEELSKKINIKFKNKQKKSNNLCSLSYADKDIIPSFDEYQRRRIVKDGKSRLQPIKLNKQRLGLEILSKKVFELLKNE